MKTQSGPSEEPRWKVWAHGVYSEPSQAAAHPALPLQMVQGCSTQSWGQIKAHDRAMMTNLQTMKLRPQTRLPEHRQERREKSQPRLCHKTPKNSKEDLKDLSQNASWGFSQAASQSPAQLWLLLFHCWGISPTAPKTQHRELNSSFISFMLDGESLCLILM